MFSMGNDAHLPLANDRILKRKNGGSCAASNAGGLVGLGNGRTTINGLPGLGQVYVGWGRGWNGVLADGLLIGNEPVGLIAALMGFHMRGPTACCFPGWELGEDGGEDRSGSVDQLAAAIKAERACNRRRAEGRS
jgi:hypothetical protein